MPNDGRPMNVQEVAAFLRIGKNKVYELAKSGELASYHVGRKLRFSPSDVEGYLAARRNGGDASAGTAGAVGAASGVGPLLAQTPRDPGVCIAGTELAADLIGNLLAQRGLATYRSYLEGYDALVSLYAERADLVVCALFDQRTNAYNVPFVQRLAPGASVIVARLFERVRGFVVHAGNPKRILSWGALLRDGVRIANVARGSSGRILLDEKLLALEATHEMVAGYSDEVPSEEAAVARVASGDADVCVGTAASLGGRGGLSFVPLQKERVDLVVRKSPQTRELVSFVRGLSDVASFKARLQALEPCNAEALGTITYEC